MHHLFQDDPAVAQIISNEESRIENTLDLIAAENHCPRSVMEAQGSVFNMKAAEGYPGRRFHAGCEHADALEKLAVSRAKHLFNAEHANVQPHSGVSANLAIYFSVLKPGDRILSMKLSHGGHLSHGDAASITSKCFQFRHYGVHPETEQIDYDHVRELALEFKPKMIVAGASSYSRLIDYERMAEIARDESAFLLVDMAHIAGLVAARVIPSPVPHSDFVTFTTYKTMMGPRGGVILCKQRHSRNIDRTIFPGSQGTPSLHMIAAKAVCFQLTMQPAFIGIQQNVLKNAVCFANEFEKKGYRIVSGGTDNHLVLVDLTPKALKGNAAETTLESVGIIVNRNVIPNDPEKPQITSGIRIGSPAITARGMGIPEVIQIVELMDTAMTNSTQKGLLRQVSDAVSKLCKQFPVYR
ncbi:MAG: serine hydroxymethyltransferase [bacterium]